MQNLDQTKTKPKQTKKKTDTNIKQYNNLGVGTTRRGEGKRRR
jgi:hypothetical protein